LVLLLGKINVMKTNATVPKNHLARITIGVAFILLIPFLAMQFSDEVDWKPNDFIIMGVLLFLTGLALSLIVKKARSNSIRLALGIAVILAFLYIWAELAVGIFTNLGN
jgi:preprotein translocase subunit SecG